MSYATRTAAVTLACPATDEMNGEPYPCEADIVVRVRSERNLDDRGSAWWDHTLDEIASPCGHALTPAQEDALLRDAADALHRRAVSAIGAERD